MKKEYLQIGDVFDIHFGDTIYAKFPEKFIYYNSEKDDLAETNITVGEIRKSSKKSQEIYKTASFVGEYVVTSATLTGGGSGHGPNDRYPDGWQITARKMKNREWDEKGIEIRFYQSGCFTAMITRKISVKKKMKMKFV